MILPLDLACFVAGERRTEIWCSLENTELARAPYNLKGFTVLLCSDKDVLTRSLRKQLNPLRITIVSAQVRICLLHERPSVSTPSQTDDFAL